MAEGGLDDGYEKEVCSGAAMIGGGTHDRNRIQIPWGALAQRDASVSGSAGFLVGTANLGAADVLRPWSVATQAGLTYFENLRENVTLPRVTTAPTGGWLSSETSPVSDATPVLGQAALTPNMYGVSIQLSMRFLQQAESAEEFIRTQLLRATGKATDAAVLNGPGSAAPLGLLNNTDITAQSGTSLGWAGVLNMQETLATAGLDDATIIWIAAPGVRELLQQREVIATSGRFVWDNDRVANRPAFATSDCPSGAMIAGDFSRAILGVWGPGLRVELNPFQDFSKGILAARVLFACDLAVPQPAAFVRSVSYLTMAAAIKVICTRPLMMHGERVEAGTVLSLTPLDAAAALGSGRAALQDQADRAALDAAIVAERDKLLAKLGRGPRDVLRFGRAA